MPISLAVNYSPEATELLAQGLINFDLYKLPDWPEMVGTVTRLHPSYVHFDLKAGDGSLSTTDWALVDRLRAVTGTKYVNLHLVAPLGLNPDDPAETEPVLQTMLADVRSVVARYGAEFVTLEHYPFSKRTSPHHVFAARPEVFSQVVRDCGCGLVLDTAHARMAAAQLGMDERDYALALPVDVLREIHVTGVGQFKGEAEDHLEMLPADWDYLDWVLTQIHTGQWATPDLLAYEYGGVGLPFRWRTEPRVLLADVPELYRRIRSYLA